MRIVQIIQKIQLRGAEVFASQLSTHLETQGHQVCMVALSGGSSVIPFEGATEIVGANMKYKMLDVPGWRKLSAIISRFRPDIIQANAGDTLRYAILARLCFRWKVPVVFRNASMLSHYLHNPVSKWLTMFLLRSADHIISVSHASKADLVKLGIDAGRISVIPIGIEEKPFNRLPEFRQEHINLVHVGGFSFEKNHLRLLHMFAELCRADERVHLWLVGDGRLKSQAEELVAGLGLQQRVTFTGAVQNPLDYLASADLALLPSIIEGLPAVILESFYVKTPVLAYDVGGVRDVIRNGVNGFITPLNNEEQFIKKIREIIAMPQLEKDRLVQTAHEDVRKDFMNSRLSERFAVLYRNLINTKKQTGNKSIA